MVRMCTAPLCHARRAGMVTPFMSDVPTREGLLADLQDSWALVRQRAALTLVTTPDVTLEDVLVTAVVRERDPFVRDTLTRALVACSDGVVPRLIALLADPVADVRQHRGSRPARRFRRGGPFRRASRTDRNRSGCRGNRSQGD